MSLTNKLENSYLELPRLFYTTLEPTQYPDAQVELLNTNVIDMLDLDKSNLVTSKGIQWMSGGLAYNGAPFAQAYAGHQYGYFTKLGDGRAAIIGEIVRNHHRYDVHLKGSGRTPYSRRGDGQATLYSMLREYLMSEAMHHLGVPTTRSLSIIKTGTTVHREISHQGAILNRVGASHIRFGTFEYARAFGTISDVQTLADYTINRHYPEYNDSSSKYLDFYKQVVQKQAALVAKWMSLGFVHGVLNTDNMLVSGETIDYGPCAFLDQYIPSTSFSSIDRNGRYSYQNQPYIVSWNLSKLAEALLPLIDTNQQQAITLLNNELKQFEALYKTHYYNLMRRKLGLIHHLDKDNECIDELLQVLEETKTDYTNFFRLLTMGEKPIVGSTTFDSWFESWNKRIQTNQQEEDAKRAMRENNPVLIPRNQLVEKALNEYAFEDNKALFMRLFQLYQDPYNYNKMYDISLLEPLDPTQSFTTYCGT